MTDLPTYTPRGGSVDMLSDTSILPVGVEVEGDERAGDFLNLLGRREEQGVKSGIWHVHATGEPHWLHEALARIAKLLDLEANWDSYGAQPVTEEASAAAVGLLLAFANPETPAPRIVPTVRGGVQIEWHTEGKDLEIEVISRARIEVAYENLFPAHVDEFTVTSDFTRLAEIFIGLHS